MLGQEIHNVAYVERGGRHYTYLFFSDGTHIELYSDKEIRFSNGLYRGTLDDLRYGRNVDDVKYAV